MHVLAPGAETWPAPQGKQTSTEVAPNTDENKPAGHKLQAQFTKQFGAFGTVSHDPYCPDPHAEAHFERDALTPEISPLSINELAMSSPDET